MDARRLSEKLALYLVADPSQSRANLAQAVDDALANGVTAVQLRAKHLNDRAILTFARDLAASCRAHNALFLVNDRVDIALAAGADGVHLGVDDLPIEDARRLLGPDAVIGYSPETDDQAKEARAKGADYLGVGPVMATASKVDAGQPIGLTALARRVEIAGIPVIGIGGITAESYREVLETGAAGAAVIGAILRSPDPGQAARKFRDAFPRATA